MLKNCKNLSFLTDCGKHFQHLAGPINMERTLLMIAAHGGCSEIVSILIKYGADVNQQDASGWTALAYAAVESEMDVINYLLENKANATIPSKNADCSNVLDLMNKLNKPDVHKFIMEQFFIKSAKRGDLIAMKKVMELSVDINATEKDEYAWNAFLYACNEGNGEIVDLLMKNGAHANATDVDGWSGLSLATRMGFLNIVKKLLENGADPNLVTKSFCSPLLFAAEENYAEIAKLLIKHGAKATICDTAGISPLTQACQLGHLEVVEALVENDEELDINKPTELGWPPLLLAAKDGYEKVVRFLVDHGADVTYIKKDETNVLHIASCKGHESITRYLCLQKKIDVDQTDMDGLTPLMFAACLGNYKLVRILVENGRANINVYETTNEWTAVFFAMQAGHLEVMKYLLNTKRVNLLHKDVEGNTLFELSENINSTAYEYLKENHVTEMERVERRDALTYAKIFKERKELYFEPMIRNIRAKCEIKAT